MTSIIRNATPADARAVSAIYNHYVLNTIVTFEEDAVSDQEMSLRIEEVSAILPWLVLVCDDRLVGYAYATKWRPRAAYRHSVESTIYFDKDMVGQGLGITLYQQLLTELQQGGIHAVIGGIALPNPRSVRLHEKLGFRKVAHLEQVGWKFDQWIDVGYWQLIF